VTIEGEGQRKEKAHTRVLEDVWKRMERAPVHVASWPYLGKGYAEVSWASASATPTRARQEQVRLGYGMTALSHCRTGAFYTATKLANIKVISDIYKQKCPCCNVWGGSGDSRAPPSNV